MVIIKTTATIKAQSYNMLQKTLSEQAKTGVIVLPWFCELLNEVPADEEVKVITDSIVAALEKELQETTEKAEKARVSEKVCRYCKNRNAPVDQSSCWACRFGECFEPERR